MNRLLAFAPALCAAHQIDRELAAMTKVIGHGRHNAGHRSTGRRETATTGRLHRVGLNPVSFRKMAEG